MNRKATEDLRLDRRLLKRRGWISKADREKEFAALPDVSEKIAPPESDDESDAAAAKSSEAPAASPPGFPSTE
jgi:hypothetical protein